MARDPRYAQRLAARLRQAGLAEAAAVLLEAADPFAFVVAQLGHVAAPLVGGGPLQSFAHLLEDPAARADLRSRLREETLP